MKRLVVGGILVIASILAPIWAYRLGDHFAYGPVVKLTPADWIFYPVLAVSITTLCTVMCAALAQKGHVAEPRKALIRFFAIALIGLLLYLLAPFAVADALGLRPSWANEGRVALMAAMMIWLWLRNSRVQRWNQ